MGGKEKDGRVGGRGKGKGGERGEDVEGPGKWSAPGSVLALGGPDHGHIKTAQQWTIMQQYGDWYTDR